MSRNQLLEVDEWITKDMQLRDPVSGDVTRPDQPPAFLMADARLREGVEAIGRFGEHIQVGIHYTAGDRSFHDAGPDYENIVGNPGNGINGLAVTSDGTLAVYGNKLSLAPWVEEDNEYHERLRIGTPEDVARICVGLEVDWANNPKTGTEDNIQRMFLKADAVRERAEQEARKPKDWRDESVIQMAKISMGIVHNTEQWYRAMRTGEQIQVHGEEREEAGRALDTILMLEKTRNLHTTRKLAFLGMRNVHEDVIRPDSIDATVKTELHLMVDAAVTPGALDYED